MNNQIVPQAARLYSLDAAGRELGGVSHWTLRKHVARGGIRSVKLANRVFMTADEVARIAREGLPSLRPHAGCAA